ncbi:hypothetical protein DBP19_26855 [Streptomyces sp. CS090A]|uniref:helix-turn-helix domain-containing protein n=1 Tax=Streptomyces sp. CS090A TaxID=2162710 RepID=UPI000D50D318|nr:helix-turn-helix transcriptional regulator [Streptomyces sp. CS090A]PVC85442.1 hypothetical protein DBP19_26855 [Streptomyces sp. CS090A]
MSVDHDGGADHEPELSDSLRTFEAVLKALRDEAGLTQEEFGPRGQYSAHFIAKIEQDKRFQSKDLVGQAETVLSPIAGRVLEATGESMSLERMSDREIRLRFLEFTPTPPDAYASGDFLRKAMHQVNDADSHERDALREYFLKAMGAGFAVFGGHAFRKRLRGTGRRSPVNKALFEAQAVTLSGYTTSEIELLAAPRSRQGFSA